MSGRYIMVRGVFKLGAPPLKSRQFIGVHKHMFVTVAYPDYTEGMLDAAADLPGDPAFGVFTWAGSVQCCINDKVNLQYYVVPPIWGFREGERDKVIKTYSTLSILQGLSGGSYYIINLPLFTREYLRARYKKSKKGKKSQ